MTYDPNIHHRRSIRLKDYDYTQSGAYFITLVTYQRNQIFGEVINGEMQLSVPGQIVRAEWMRSIGIRKEIQLYEDEFVVMPNHVHGIIWIVEVEGMGSIRFKEDGGLIIEGGARRAPQQPSPQQPSPQPSSKPSPVGADGIHPIGIRPDGIFHRKPKSLGSFLAGFKASVTSRARNELNMTDIWQRNYYEHIIRNEIEFEKIWAYIENNPRQWQSDQLHPSAPSNKFNLG